MFSDEIEDRVTKRRPQKPEESEVARFSSMTVSTSAALETRRPMSGREMPGIRGLSGFSEASRCVER